MTPEQLNAAFSWEFTEDTDAVTYRKYTTDTLPTYTLTLKNASSEFFIDVTAVKQPYITLTQLNGNLPLNLSSGLTLEPNGVAEVLLTFSTSLIDEAIDLLPRVTFILKAVTEETVVTPASPTNTPPSSDDIPPTTPPLNPISDDNRGGRTEEEYEQDTPDPLYDIPTNDQ
jgi:hypothetical protein